MTCNCMCNKCDETGEHCYGNGCNDEIDPESDFIANGGIFAGDENEI